MSDEIDIEITFKNGNREIHQVESISFHGLNSFFEPFLEEKILTPKVKVTEQIRAVFEIIHRLDITKVRFGSFRCLEFSEIDDDNDDVSFRVKTSNPESEKPEEKFAESLKKGEKPDIKDLLEGLASGAIQMEVITPSGLGLPVDLQERLQSVLQELVGGECEGCHVCEPENHKKH